MKSVNPLRTETELHIAALAGGLIRALRTAMRERGWEDLRPSQLRFLDAVDPQVGNTVTELAAAQQMSKQAAGQFVTLLAGAGCLETRRDAADGRRRLVALTPTGHSIVRKMKADLADLERSWAAAVGIEHYRTFRAVLEQLGIDELDHVPSSAV